jgi:outer membrane protein, multidrug efflux system
MLSKLNLFVLLLIMVWGCAPSKSVIRSVEKVTPDRYTVSNDSTNVVQQDWKSYFSDENLIALIDTALSKNQELNIILQEIEISKNEASARKGEYLPSVGFRAGSGIEKAGKFTRNGAVEEQLFIDENKHFPEPLQDYFLGFTASWELDIWKKLRNSQKSAVLNYLATIEGQHFMVSHLISEIADSYYELLALDNLLDIVNQNIEIQTNAFQIVKKQKEFAQVTELAVNRFQAQLLNTQNLQFEISQQLVETENRLNFLCGRYPQPIQRKAETFLQVDVQSVQTGIPSQLLRNRADIRQAELLLEASKLDVKAARAEFYPSIELTAGLGLQAFNPVYLIKPESFLYSLGGDLIAPLVNRKAIEANYNSANAKQLQAVFQYEQTVLQAYVDVLNQLAKLDNFSKSFETKTQEVDLLYRSVDIANSLFNSARADYAEVLLTQREALESKMELIEIKMKQLHAKVGIYQALGGGWQNL